MYFLHSSFQSMIEEFNLYSCCIVSIFVMSYVIFFLLPSISAKLKTTLYILLLEQQTKLKLLIERESVK